MNQQDKEPSLCKISIANQKGGVGKTTTSVNLAASLAVAGKKTLLIDLDPQGNATSGLGVDRFVSTTIYDVLIGKTSLEDSLQNTEIESLKVIPANQNLIGAEVELINAISREKKLKNALKALPEDFDFVIFDCPPSLGLLTINAFTASDSIMIPLQCEYYAMEGLGQLLNTFQIVKEDLNQELRIEGIILTMFDARNKLTHEVLSEMKAHFPNELYEAKVPRNVKLSEAPSFGKPAFLYDVDSKGARSYLEIAAELLTRNGYEAPDWNAVVKAQQDKVKEALKASQPAPASEPETREAPAAQQPVEEVISEPVAQASSEQTDVSLETPGLEENQKSNLRAEMNEPVDVEVGKQVEQSLVMHTLYKEKRVNRIEPETVV